MFDGRTSRGFTLVELLIALGLMAILVTAVSQVFATAQQVFGETDAKVLLYQNVRIMFDQMERDLNNAENTYQMEFFDDTSPNNGVYDAGEEKAELETYDYGATFTQATYTDRENVVHRADEMYFRTLTTFRGKTRVVLVHYKLRYEDDSGNVIRLPVLERKLRYVEDSDGGNVTLNDEWEIGGRYNYLADFQVQPFYSDRRERMQGQYWSPKPLADTGEDRHELWRYGSTENTVVGIYRGLNNDGTLLYDAFLESHYLVSTTNNRFGLLSPGDKMLVTFPPPGGGPDTRKSVTVKHIYEEQAAPNKLLIFFNEGLELPANATNVPAQYLASWLPPSVKVTCRVKDSSARKERVVSRVFRLLRS